MKASLLTLFFIGLTFITRGQNCDFTISQSAATSGCQVAREDVVWTSSTNVTIATNNLTKNAGGNNWNAGANSTSVVYSLGYIETTVAETNTNRTIGLSNVDGGVDEASIEYAIRLRSNGTLRIYESGVQRVANAGAYNTGDIISIVLDNSVVKYFQNGNLLYISSVAPTLPLIADVSLNSNNSTLQSVVLANLTDGSFTSSAGGTGPGTGATYSWLLNGFAVGSSATYSNSSLADGDILTCTLTPGVGGCDVVPVASNQIVIRDVSDIEDFSLHYILATRENSACVQAIEEVVWTDVINLDATGNNLTKIQGNGGNFDAGAFSLNSVANNGYVETTVNETNRDRTIGLSNSNGGADEASIEYAIRLRNNGTLRIYESGVQMVGNAGAYANGDVIRIAVDNGEVKYFLNGVLLYNSTVAPTLPLQADVSFEDTGGTLENVVVVNGFVDTFTAITTNVGSNPQYQWKLNGVDEPGENASTYTNASLVDGDQITCEIIPDLPGCGSLVYESETITVQLIATPNFGDFYIESTHSSSACQEATEEVTWTDAIGLDVTGNDLVKIQGGQAWNAGAFSFNSVADNGYVQTTVNETNTDRTIGLSASNGGVDEVSIEYAIRLRNNGTLRIYESGVQVVGNAGSYANGDLVRIGVVNGEVKYYLNGALLYNSAVAPTLPLKVDVSLEDDNATIEDVVVVNGNTGTYTATATNAGASPNYQWQLGGVDIPGANSATYVNTGLADGSVLTCVVQPDLGGCGTVSYTSGSITVINRPAAIFGDFYIESTHSSSACQEATEEVSWGEAIGIDVTGNDIVKIQGGQAWNAGAFSFNSVADNGYVETRVNETNRDRTIGLSTTNGGVDETSIEYAIRLRNNGTLRIYESGVQMVGNAGSYANGDLVRIGVVNGEVKYYLNGALLYNSTVAPTLPLKADVSLEDEGSTLEDVVVVNGNTGTYTATATDAGASPSYQWQLGGVDIPGANSATYVNTGLTDGSVLTCVVQPDLGGCGTVSYTSGSITVINRPAAIFGDFYIESTHSSSACQEATEEVTWTDAIGLDVTGNDIVKIQGGEAWNAGAFSFNSVADNGYVETTVNETNRDRTIGLSTTNGGVNETSIEYAIRLRNNGQLRIYESGVEVVGNAGTYANGDIIRLGVVNGEVKYYLNGTLLYNSTVTPTLPLKVDVSLEDDNATLENVVVVNGNTGTYTATATNAGASPSYQWQLGGVDIPGANSSTYINTALADGSVLTCVVQPDLGGCGTVTYTSGSITVNDKAAPAFGEFYIQNTPEGGNILAAEEVEWTDAIGVDASGNNLTKIQGGSSFNAGAFSLATVSNNGLVETTVNETNTDRTIGLSAVNGGVDEASIQYAIRLRNNGTLRIYESGVQRVGNAGTYSGGDVIKVSVVNNVVEYYRNTTLLYTSLVAPSLPLKVDVSMEDVNSTLQNVNIVHYTEGNFTSTASGAGASPTYEWRLNGALVGTSATYSNPLVAPTDVITCTISPDFGGCTTATLISNQIEIRSLEEPLPIDLIFFKVNAMADHIRLSWSTSTEVDNDFFTLEKSSNGKDFSVLTTIPGAGNSTAVLEYKYEDYAPVSGLSYYRLSQTDFDGTTEVFDVQIVNYISPITATVYPNPNSGRFHVHTETEIKGISLIDINGLSKSLPVISTEQGYFVNETDLTPGVYILKLDSEFTSTELQLIITR